MVWHKLALKRKLFRRLLMKIHILLPCGFSHRQRSYWLYFLTYPRPSKLHRDTKSCIHYTLESLTVDCFVVWPTFSEMAHSMSEFSHQPLFLSQPGLWGTSGRSIQFHLIHRRHHRCAVSNYILCFYSTFHRQHCIFPALWLSSLWTPCLSRNA